MRAAAYTRVSTAAQATEDKVSLEQQLKDIEAHCASKGYRIVHHYQDVGSGASKRRPEFQRMLKDAREGAFDVIVAWKSDRLSRGMYPAAALMEAIEGSEIALEAVKDAIDINTFGLLAAVGKIELDNIRERVKMGMRGRALMGKAPGRVKFGYSKDEQGFPVIDETQAPVIRRIFSEYAAGSTRSEIVEGLTRDLISTAPGNQWTTRGITAIVRDTTYMGEGYYARRRRVLLDNGTQVSKVYPYPQDEWIRVPYPRIVDKATWDAADRVRRKNKQLHEHKGLNLAFPLRGLINCGSCGHRFNVRTGIDYGRYKQPDGTFVYRRTGRYTRQYICHGGVNKKLRSCERKRIGAVTLERTVWEVVRKTLEHPDEITELLHKRREDFEAGHVIPELEAAKRDLAAVQEKERRAVTAFVSGYVDQEGLDYQLRLLKERLEHYQSTVERLQTEAGRIRDQIALLEEVATSADSIAKRLNSISAGEQAELMSHMVDSVVAHKDRVDVVLALGNTRVLAGVTAHSGPPSRP